MKQLLCLSYTTWRAWPDRTQQLLTRFNDVEILFFEPAAERASWFTRPQGRRVRPHITVYTLPTPLPAPGDAAILAQRRREKCSLYIQKVMAKHQFREPVLWCNHPAQAPFIDELAYRGLVYDCHRLWGDEWLDRESDLAGRSDVVFAASKALAERLSPCSKNVALLPNGSNPLIFTQQPTGVPHIIASLRGHRLLCRVGDLTAQTELSPLIYAAQHRMEWQFLLVGRYTQPVADRLKELGNVHLVGQVDPMDVPDYLAPCDLLFDLLQRDQRPAGVVPIRVYEYLATGKPIVLMAEPGLEEPLGDAVYTSYDEEGFLYRCSLAMREKTSLAPIRQEYARMAAWPNRAAECMSLLETGGLF